MKIIITLLILGTLAFIIFFHKPTEKSQDEQEKEAPSGIIIEKYNTYQGGINDAKSVVSQIEERNKNDF